MAITLSSGSAPSASNASTGLASTITMITPMRMKRLDRLIGPERQPLADLVEVGVGVRHELAGLRLVVVREVQQLEMREETGAEVGLDPVRHAERAVAAHAHADALEHADEDDQPRVLDDLAGVARHDALVDGRGDEQRDRELGARPEQRGEHAEDDPAPLGAERVSEEAPSLAAQHLVAVGQTLRTATHTTSNTDYLDRVSRRARTGVRLPRGLERAFDP